MTFSQKFATYACVGDQITCTVDGYDVTATIVHDDQSGAPYVEDDGFWPSLDRHRAGYIGDKSKATLARHTAKAQAILDAWRRDDWFWCGVVLSVSRDGAKLSDHAASLWSIECNYPTFTKAQARASNAYLSVVANDLLGDALDAARANEA